MHALALERRIEARPEGVLGIVEEGHLPPAHAHIEPAASGGPDDPGVLRAEIPLQDVTEMERVKFVMKGGMVMRDQLTTPAVSPAAR